jgi:hypothetical protein
VEAFLGDPCAVVIPSPSSKLEVTGFDFIPFWGLLAMVEGDQVALGGGGAMGGFIFFFVLVSVGGLEGDGNGVGGWGRGKWREHAGVFNFPFFFFFFYNII